MSDTIRMPVDVTNPGQFFACCGLLELAARKWPDAVGHFCSDTFLMGNVGPLSELLLAIAEDPPVACDPEDPMTSPLILECFRLRLDWWWDELAGGKAFKTWAGQEQIVAKAHAMHATFVGATYGEATLLSSSAILFAAGDSKKAIAPLYFDACRVGQAQSIDVGFSTDTHGLRVPTCAALEYLCLVGLQRFRPVSREDRAFTYTAWLTPLPPALAAAAATGGTGFNRGDSYSFRLLYRTKYLKGFLAATRIGDTT